MPGENAHELTSRVTDLKSELEDLEQKERMLDQQKFWVEQSIRNTTEDCSKYPFCFGLFFYRRHSKEWRNVCVYWKCFTFPALTVKCKTENEMSDSIFSQI